MKIKALFARLSEDWPVKIISLAAALILFLFNSLTNVSERFVSVSLQVHFHADYTAANPLPQKVRVRLRGAEAAIFSVMEEDLAAYADLARHEGEGVHRAPVMIRKRGTAETADPLDIAVEPPEVAVTLERRMSRSVEITPVLRGSPSFGFELKETFVNPARVSVEGPRSLIEAMSAIDTEEIDLSGRRESFSATVRLKSENPLIAFPGGTMVEFRAMIGETIIARTYGEVEMIAYDLSPTLRVVGALPSGTVHMQGGQAIFESLTAGNIRLTVDCSSVRMPGVYRLPVAPDVPSGLMVLGFSPETVELEFAQARGVDW